MIAGLIVGIFALQVPGKRKREERPMSPQKLGSPEDILNEVEVYISYELKAEAIKLLKEGRNKYPNNEKIQKKLSQLTKYKSNDVRIANLHPYLLAQYSPNKRMQSDLPLRAPRAALGR